MPSGPVRVLLVGSSVTSTTNADYMAPRFAVPPLGLHQLAHHARRRLGDLVEVEVLDPVLLGARRLDLLATRNFDIIGFGPTHIAFPGDRELMAAIRDLARTRSERCPIFLAGGSEATMNAQALCAIMPWLDACILGPGEEALESLVLDLAGGQSRELAVQNLRARAGVAWGASGAFASVPMAGHAPMEPYDGEGIPYDTYWLHNHAVLPPSGDAHITLRVCRVITTAYCPHNCRFCSHHVEGRAVFGTPVPMLAMSEVADVLRSVTQLYDPDGVFFNDSDIFQTPARGRVLLETIIRLKASQEIAADLRFYGQTRVDSVDDTVLALARRAGFVYLSFGVESLDSRSLAAPDLRKGYTAALAYRAVLAALRTGIPVTNLNLIMLHPTATKTSIARTICRCVDLIRASLSERGRLAFWIEGTVKTYPGAPICEVATHRGWPIREVTVQGEGGMGETVRLPVEVLPADPLLRRVAEEHVLESSYASLRDGSARRDWGPGENALAVFLKLWDELDLDGLRPGRHRGDIVALQDVLRGRGRASGEA